MRPVFFSDLDDTIFQTARKMKEGLANATIAAQALNGSHSYMNSSQSVMMAWLLESTRFIPVTARSTESLRRCTLSFTDYQVCSNGALICRPDGSLDQYWFDITKRHAAAAQGLLNELLAVVREQTEAGRFRCWIVEECGVGLYFCVKSNERIEWLNEIDDTLTALAGNELIRHRNDNNLSFTPAGFSKRSAVEYLAESLLDEGRVPIFGMGDSLTDLPFMASCDMLVIPKGSQIDCQILRSGSR